MWAVVPAMAGKSGRWALNMFMIFTLLTVVGVLFTMYLRSSAAGVYSVLERLTPLSLSENKTMRSEVTSAGRPLSGKSPVILTKSVKMPEEVCPELRDIPNLVNNRTLDVETQIPMDQVEQLMFGTFKDHVRETVSIGNQRIESRLKSQEMENHSIQQPFTKSLSSLEVYNGNYIYIPGGHWKPANCTPRWMVAIVVPFRNRTTQLAIFLRYIVPFLQKQLLEFSIFVVNQENNLLFNRAMLMNTGFLEALHFHRWDCFVFHDVDHLPESEFNPYGCVDLPRHFIAGASNRNYRVPYSTSFGGVNGFTTAQFRKINGFSNAYWGWCCEDDDLDQRVGSAGLGKIRYKGRVGYYKAIMLNHVKSAKTNDRENRMNLKNSRKRFKTDGLNSIQYGTPHIELHPLYTNISVDIRRQ